MTEVENHFTVFVRLPFNRGDFVDPPPVAWSASKERALWDVLSRQAKGHEIDWRELAEEFKVTQSFLLQQAAWMYERQLSQVKAQMRRVGAGGAASRQSGTPSPIPSSVSGSVLGIGGQAMRRDGSGGSRVPSRLSAQAQQKSVEGADSVPGTPVRGKAPTSLRVSATQSTPGRRTPLLRQRSKEDSTTQATASPRRMSAQSVPLSQSPREEPDPEEESTTDSDESPAVPVGRRQNIVSSKRTVGNKKASAPRQQNQSDDDDSQGDSSPFLPFATGHTTGGSSRNQDPSATLRGGFGTPAHAQRPSNQRRGTMERISSGRPSTADHPSASSTSSLSSGPTPARQASAKNTLPASSQRAPGPLSPRRKAELAAADLSPRRRAAGSGKDGSDGTPSMGSSFSDLDDTSVTQSALEEALMSNMQHGGNGGMASRMSTISQALKSRYFEPGSGR